MKLPPRLPLAHAAAPLAAVSLVALTLAACVDVEQGVASVGQIDHPEDVRELATFGAGCYWCAEAAFEQLEGVVDVRSGFMGGDHVADPTDASALVAAGHAEVVQVTYDPLVVSYGTLVDWFWRIHDPTSVDRQGEDEGHEYRSAIFYHSPLQRRVAEVSLEHLQETLARPVVTEVAPAGPFHPASADQQDYYRRNRAGEYCQRVIAPHLRAAGLHD